MPLRRKRAAPICPTHHKYKHDININRQLKIPAVMTLKVEPPNPLQPCGTRHALTSFRFTDRPCHTKWHPGLQQFLYNSISGVTGFHLEPI